MNWTDALQDLARVVSTWANLEGFLTTTFDPQADEVLVELKHPQGDRILLEPARFTVGKLPAVVDMYVYPAMRRVRLVGPTAQSWEVVTSQGVPMGYSWDREGFAKLLNVLIDEPVPVRV